MAISRKLRITLVHLSDTASAALAWYLAFALRFNFDVSADNRGVILKTLPVVVIVQSLVFLAFGLYRGLWRFASLPDIQRIVLTVCTAVPITATALVFLGFLPGVPRSAWPLDFILLIFCMAGMRIAYRLYKEFFKYGFQQRKGEPVIVLGAGSAGLNLVKDLARSTEWKVVAVLDDDVSTHGGLLYNTKIVGGLEILPHVAHDLEAKHAIVAMPSASYKQRSRAVQLCQEAGVEILTVPSSDDLMSGRVTVAQIRKIDVEDLLGREPVVLDSAGLRNFIEGKTIMVTGAGGSIGSELCRQIATFKPKSLVFFEKSEPSLYHLEQEFSYKNESGHEHAVPFHAIAGDVCNEVRLNYVLDLYKPEVVFHAAAYKHVPLMEKDNAWEAVQNNVVGTYTLARASMKLGVKKLVLISTDKAVNPTNVMGATKRLAEMLCQGLHGVYVQSPVGAAPLDFKFVTVRFGNVLGSQGSVIPKFREQIARGGPVTVTHPEIERFFMSIPEAAQLVLQAALMGQGSEIFVLDMGKSIKIRDLARDMIKLSGFSEEDIKIVYSGLRSGEKLYEELFADGEDNKGTPHPKLKIASARKIGAEWLERCLAFIGQNKFLSDAETKAGLKSLIQEYVEASHSKTSDSGPSSTPTKKIVPFTSSRPGNS